MKKSCELFLNNNFMSTYQVRTIDREGATHEEVAEVGDRASYYAELKAKGSTLVSMVEVADKKKKSILSLEIPFLSGVKLQDKINFTRNLASMLDAGLALSRALTVIEKQTAAKKFKEIIGALNASIRSGKTLSESMKEHGDTFPPLVVSMVRAGEESGSLSQSLRIVSTQMENSYALGRKIRGALMYPGVITIAMVAIGFFMLTNVVPTLASTFQSFNAQLPPQTQFVIDLSSFFQAYFIEIIIGVLVAAAAFYMFNRTATGKRWNSYVYLHLPVIGPIMKEMNSARTARTLASLLSAGVDFLVAVRITADVLQNPFYKDVILLVEKRVEKGEPIAEIFNQRLSLYPPFVGEMISVGEETGQLPQMLLGVATFYEADIDQKTKDMSSIIEPVLMIVIGVAVGFFAISIISPIYSLSSVIS